MSLIAILLSLVLERILGSLEELRRFDWFLAYYRWGSGHLARYPWLDGPAGALLLLLPLLGAVVAINYYLSSVWLLLGLLFSILTLLYCFGPRDLEAEVEAFVDARRRGDEESAYWHASELLGGGEFDDSTSLSRRIMANIFVEANERLLAIVFWFVLLGPVGALLYRFSSQLYRVRIAAGESGLYEAGARLHLLLVWPPAHLTALAYALAGSFVEAIHGWRESDTSWPEGARHTLIAMGFGALRIARDEIEEEATTCELVQEAMALVRRAVLVFLSLVALSTLAGWLS